MKAFGTAPSREFSLNNGFTSKVADGAISSSTLRAHGVVSTPNLLIVRNSEPLSSSIRDQVSGIVERAGYPATNLRSSDIDYLGTPPPLVVLIAGLVILLIVGAAVAVLAGTLDDRTTLRTLESLGTSTSSPPVTIWRASGFICVIGTLSGSVVGLILAGIWAANNLVPLSINIGAIGAALLILCISQIVSLGGVGIFRKRLH